MEPKKNESILIVDDEEKIRSILSVILRDEGYSVETAKNGIEAIEKAKRSMPQLAIVDLQMPKLDGIETCMRLKETVPGIVTVILTAHGSIQSAVQAIKQGVYDYITKPFDNDQLLTLVKRGLEYHALTQEVRKLKHELRQRYGVENIIGESYAMQTLREQIAHIAQTDATVLIEGETGTGKELAARAIHYESDRRGNPFIVVDCAAIPSTLIENEFFGHERGAFTDARERTAGKFEEANTGTIFLDEIGELPLEAQTKLLRVLQEREFTRVGSTTPIKVDVRIIAATNKNLGEQVKAGKFRDDLYYRLNVLTLRIPPLREHSDDIPAYAQHFLMKYRETFGKHITGISEEALTALRRNEWKGNIRELENTIQRAMLNARSDCLQIDDFHTIRSTTPSFTLEDGMERYINSIVERTERQVILDALAKTHGNRTAAAEMLKISRKTLFNKMQEYGIE